MKWEKVSLGDVCSFKTGKTPSTKNPEYFNGDICWYTPGDIGEHVYLKKSARTVSELAVEKKHAVLLPKNTILLTCIGEIRRVGILSNAACTNQQITGLIFTDNISPRFAYYWFLANKRKLLERSNNAVLPILNNAALKEITFDYPPLPIQQQIADTLDKADALRRKDQQLLDKYDELAQAVFYDMFGDLVRNEKGWEKKALHNLIKIETKSIKPEDTAGRNYVGLENIEKGTGVVSVSSDVDLKSNKFLFDKECILYGKLRPYLKKVATPNFDGVCSTDIFPIRCTGIEKEFAVTILRSQRFTDFASNSSVGANLPRVNKDAILSYETICPPIKLQENFSKLVKQIKKETLLVKTSESLFESLFSQLLGRFFK